MKFSFSVDKQYEDPKTYPPLDRPLAYVTEQAPLSLVGEVVELLRREATPSGLGWDHIRFVRPTEASGPYGALFRGAIHRISNESCYLGISWRFAPFSFLIPRRFRPWAHVCVSVRGALKKATVGPEGLNGPNQDVPGGLEVLVQYHDHTRQYLPGPWEQWIGEQVKSSRRSTTTSRGGAHE